MINSTSKIEEYIKKLKLGKICEMNYTFSNEIKKILKCEKNEIIFKSHQELDEIVNKLLKEIPNFEIEFKDDFDVILFFNFLLKMK